MEFKKLEIEPEHKGLTAIIKSEQFKRSLIAILIGALAGFGHFYFTEGRQMETIFFGDFIQNVLIGSFLGFFVTNSPCARNKC